MAQMTLEANSASGSHLSIRSKRRRRLPWSPPLECEPDCDLEPEPEPALEPKDGPGARAEALLTVDPCVCADGPGVTELPNRASLLLTSCAELARVVPAELLERAGKAS